MSQRNSTAMLLFFLAALILFANAMYDFTTGRHVAWQDIVAGVALVAGGVYFKTVKRPA